MHGEKTRQRVFLTFAADDLPLARPVTARLRAAGTVVFDQALTGGPFVSARGEIIRASLLARLRRCTSALCLYGARTHEDDWVRWALASATELELPLFGAALTPHHARDAERLLVRLGAELLPLDSAHIVACAEAAGPARDPRPVDVTTIAEALHLMRHSNR